MVFWKVCEALDSEMRIRLLRYLMAVDETEFPCVSELAGCFKVSEPAMSVHLKKLAVEARGGVRRYDGDLARYDVSAWCDRVLGICGELYGGRS